jgi:hypothetical protein
MSLLLNVPWWMVAGLGALGIILFVAGNRRREDMLRNAGAVLVVAAIGWAAVSYYMDTPLERAANRSRELVASVIDKNWPVTQAILAPNASLSVLSADAAVYTSREQIIDGAKQAVDQYGLKSATILSLQARQDGGLITVDLDILSDQDVTMGRPITTSWQFEWQKSGEQWVLTRITCLRIGNSEGPAAQRQFPSPR